MAILDTLRDTRIARRLQLDYVDCYLIHTPFAFHLGDEQDPSRDAIAREITR